MNVSEHLEFTRGDAPIFLEMPHSGRVGVESADGIPAALAKRIRLDSSAVRDALVFGCDVAVPMMSGFEDLVRDFNLTGLRNNLARVYIDTNRTKDAVSGLAVGGFRDDHYQHGVIWSRTIPKGIDLSLEFAELERLVNQRTEKIYREPISEAEYDELLKMIYDPYHALIKSSHETIVKRHGCCIHLALHSLAPYGVTSVNGGYVCGEVASRGSFSQSKNQLPDVILIHNGFRAANRKYVDAVRRALESEGLIVEDGIGPFLGDSGVTALYGNPTAGHHVIGIEHVTHGIEINRLSGSLEINEEKAARNQAAYRKVIDHVLGAFNE